MPLLGLLSHFSEPGQKRMAPLSAVISSRHSKNVYTPTSSTSKQLPGKKKKMAWKKNQKKTQRLIRITAICSSTACRCSCNYSIPWNGYLNLTVNINNRNLPFHCLPLFLRPFHRPTNVVTDALTRSSITAFQTQAFGTSSWFEKACNSSFSTFHCSCDSPVYQHFPFLTFHYSCDPLNYQLAL